MGVMTAIAVNYVVNPLSKIWEGIKFGMELSGYVRAANELRRLGYYKEADKVLQSAREFIASK
jgi:hypothetical protein